MSIQRTHGWLASAGALVTAVALALGGAAAAQAAPTKMPESSGMVITKLEQPDVPGSVATGLPTESDQAPIAGVTFEAFAVPLEHDPFTNDWQQEIANTTLAQAQGKISGTSSSRSGVTNGDGEIRWQTGVDGAQGDNLAAGLWLIRETNTPAGVVAAGDFIVAVPLTHPTDRTSWLDTIYVYPKNKVIEGSKTVENLESFVVGDTVTWDIVIDNPSPQDSAGNIVPADLLRVVDVIEDAYLTTQADGSGVNVVGPKGMVRNTDYTVTVVPNAGKTTITINFTAGGLTKISQAPTESVHVTLATKIEQSGVIENSAQFFSSENQSDPKDIPGTSMKYGDYALVKQSEGGPAGVSLAGAEFMVFVSEADALAAMDGDQEALDRVVKPNVAVPGYDQDRGVWATNDDGRVDITGLRYSGFANGESFGDDDPRFVTYWLVETKGLDDHQLLAEPMSFLVNEDSATQSEQIIVNQYDRGGFVLPLTGGAGTLLLTIAGLALLATVLVIARRRQNATAAGE